MKICFKCNRMLPISEFYKHPQMKDGTLNKCKQCAKSDVRKNYREKLDKYHEYETHRNSTLNAISAVFSNEAAEQTDSDEVTLKLSSDNCNELISAMIVAISYVKTAADEHTLSEPEDKERIQGLTQKTETWRDILRQVASVLQKEQDGQQ